MNTAGDANRGWRSFGSSTLARACLVASLVLLVAVVVVVAVVDRSSGPPHVASLGTLDVPSTTVARTLAPTTARADAQPPVTYPVATTVPAPVPPVSLTIPAIGVAADVVGVGVVPGTDEVEVPDIEHVGWFRLGPSPGQDGSSVLVGHVDGEGRPGAFFRLGDLVPGDVVTVTDTSGAHDFRVTGREQYAKAALPADFFSRAGPPRLVLITCGGAFDGSTGHYVDNVVVVAIPV